MFGIEIPEGSGVVALLVAIGVAIIVILICREIVCWYFKINEHIQDQWKQLVVLRKILAILESNQRESIADKNERRLGRRLYCQQCGEDITHMPAECPKCNKELQYVTQEGENN